MKSRGLLTYSINSDPLTLSSLFHISPIIYFYITNNQGKANIYKFGSSQIICPNLRDFEQLNR
jgi:hypothetical protein